MSLYETHEPDSITRYCDMQERLNTAVAAAKSSKPDEALHLLADQVEVQLKLEDFILRSREANHPWTRVWGPIFAPAAVSFLVALITTITTLLLRSQK
jgi:hypothetical protein